MDINTLREVAVVLGALAFIGVCWWAFSPRRKKRFEEDAMLPFADEEKSERSAQRADRDGDEAPTEERGSAERGSSAVREKPSALKDKPSTAATEKKPSAGVDSDSVGAKKKGQDKQ